MPGRRLWLGSTVSFVAPFVLLVPATAQTIPAQIIPSIPELGAPTFSFPSGGGTMGDAGGASPDMGNAASTSAAAGGGDPLTQMMSASYGNAAASAATAAGITPASLAAFGEVESNFRNVAAANGSTTATGVWQITQGTWDDTVSKYGLPYTDADRNDPSAQASVASYIISSYASSVSSATNSPATVAQTYGAYLFGPTAGGNLASAPADTPLSDYVSSSSLANNNMSGWTVGQFYATMAGKLGNAANDVVKTG